MHDVPTNHLVSIVYHIFVVKERSLDIKESTYYIYVGLSYPFGMKTSPLYYPQRGAYVPIPLVE
jgi:hypothetical protein